jgi:glucose-6-phosphate-specific signal transduction histidine kinase
MSSIEATQLFRLCHDLVSNAVKKRLASRIRIALREGTDRVDLVVRHDGREQRPAAVEDTSPFAYRLRYRARLLEATLAESEEDGWTVTRCSFRLGREARHD